MIRIQGLKTGEIYQNSLTATEDVC